MSIQVEWRKGQDRFPHLHWRLDEEAFGAFVSYGEERTFAAGEQIFAEGDGSFSIYLVVAGEVAIERGGETISRIGVNHSFGEMGLLRDAPRAASARAATEVQLVELTRQGLHRMLEEAPVWAARLYRVLAECLAQYLHGAATARGEK